MKKILAVLLFLTMVLAAVGLFAYRNYDPYRGLPSITIDRLNAEETAWYSEGIFDYRLLGEVRFASEKRRYEIVVADNVLQSAMSARMDEESGTWGEFRPTPDEEAEFFTIPGMFSMMRRDLVNDQVKREALRMALADGQAYPGLIFLGNIIQEGVVMDGTQLVVEVIEFEAITP